MSQIKDCSASIACMSMDAAKMILAWEELSGALHDYIEKVIKAAITISNEIFLSSSIDELYLSPMTIDELFDEPNRDSISLTGTPPKEYARSLHKHRGQPPIHYNYIPRAHRNQPYQRRAY